MQISERSRRGFLMGAVGTSLLVVLVAMLAAAASASAAAPASKSYVVVLKDEVAHPAFLAHRHERNRGAEVDHIYGVALKGYSAELTRNELKAIRKDPNVDYVESDGVIEPRGQTVGTPLKRVYANLSKLHIDENDVPADRVNADIAILDTGVAQHPDLNIVSRVTCVGGSGCKAGQFDDDKAGHGTHVAGDAAAIDNNIGTVGTAPGARIWSVKVIDYMVNAGYDEVGQTLGGIDPEQSGYTNLQDGNAKMSDAIAGINFVTAHSSEIEVANMSFDCVTDQGGCAHTALAQAIATSVNSGVVWVAAAGYQGKKVVNGGPYPSKETSYPAALPDVITVSAIADYDGLPGSHSNLSACPSDLENGFPQHDDRLSMADTGFGSNFGPEVDIAAPGACVLSTWSPYNLFNHYGPPPGIPTGNEYAYMFGSSVASALVAGAAADIAAGYNPSTRADVETIKNTLTSAGNYNWEDLRPEYEGGPPAAPDFFKEPLLDMRFAQPSVNTTANPPVGYTTATLDGWVNPNGAATNFYFQYGKTAAYGTNIPAPPGSSIGSGTSSEHVVQGLSGLALGTTYHYRLVASNVLGTAYGQDQAFTTLAYPPEVSTDPASGVQPTKATLNGHVNPKGTSTRYYFEYGLTTAYGSRSPAAPGAEAGAGTSSLAVSTTATGLIPGSTYHYRIVAENAGGASTGADRSFTATPDPGAGTWAVRTTPSEANGWQWVFYRGSEGQLTTTYYNGSSWGSKALGDKIAAGTTPSVIRQPTSDPNGYIWVFYQGTDGTLHEAKMTPTGWLAPRSLGVPMAPGTSPSAVRSPEADPNGWQYVFYQDANHQLHEAYYTGTGWGEKVLGGAMDPASSPSAVRSPDTDPNAWTYVFYQGANHRLQETYYAGIAGWAGKELGGTMAPGTSPAAVRSPDPDPNAWAYVFYQGSNNRLQEAYYAGTSGWANKELGGAMTPSSSPAAVRAADTDPNAWTYVFYQGSNKQLQETYYAGTSGWANKELGGTMVTGTTPAAVRIPSADPSGWQWVFWAGANANGTTTLHETYYAPSGWASLDFGTPFLWF